MDVSKLIQLPIKEEKNLMKQIYNTLMYEELIEDLILYDH